MLKKTIVTAIALSGLTLFSAHAAEQVNTPLSVLKNIELKQNFLDESIGESTNVVNLRLKAMKDAAVMVGAQHGYISQMNKRKREIMQNESELDSLFDFGMIMRLSGGALDEMYLLPPVIQEAKNVIAVSDDANELRISDTYINILSPARLVLTPPDWRQYLIYDQKIETSNPPDALLPKTKEERALWSQWVEDGWTAGEIQGEREMVYRERKLGRDFNGMLVYLRYTMSNGITKPIVVSTFEDVVGGGNEMRIGEKVIRIATPGLLNSNAESWKPLIMDTRGSLAYDME